MGFSLGVKSDDQFPKLHLSAKLGNHLDQCDISVKQDALHSYWAHDVYIRIASVYTYISRVNTLVC